MNFKQFGATVVFALLWTAYIFTATILPNGKPEFMVLFTGAAILLPLTLDFRQIWKELA